LERIRDSFTEQGFLVSISRWKERVLKDGKHNKDINYRAQHLNLREMQKNHFIDRTKDYELKDLKAVKKDLIVGFGGQTR
jgi:hypothetical protein